jgi:hypothetical protein
MANWYTHPLTGENIMPRAKYVSRPSAIAGLKALDVCEFWKNEFGLTRTSTNGTPTYSDASNLRGTIDYFGASTSDWRVSPETDVSGYSSRTSWSGRFCMCFHHTSYPLTFGYSDAPQVDMQSLTGYTVPAFYTGRYLPWLGVFIGERDNPYYFLRNVQAGAEPGINAYVNNNYNSTPATGNLVIYRFPLGDNFDSTNVLCWLIVRMVLKNRGGTTASIAGYETVGVEYFIESVDTITPGANVEVHFFTLNEGDSTPASSSTTITAVDGDSFSLEGGMSHYIALREELQDPELFTVLGGTVTDGGVPVERDVHILEGASFGLVGSTRSASDGSWSYTVRPDTEYCVICRDEGTTPRNSLIFDRVYGSNQL